MRFTSNLIKIC